jgi:predicted Fe-S protein YdhL (DUF1289 family)
MMNQEFVSLWSSHIFHNTGVVAQLVRASDCHSEGRGFDPRPSRMKKVKSPCVKQCKLQDDYCFGCFRHIDEIVKWRHLTNEEKTVILQELEQRKMARWSELAEAPLS